MVLTRRFHQDKPEKYSKPFVSRCIYYLSTTGSSKVLLLFRQAVFGTKLNNLLQFDQSRLKKYSTIVMNFLMMSEDNSGYTWLYSTPNENAEEAVHGVGDCCALLRPQRSLFQTTLRTTVIKVSTFSRVVQNVEINLHKPTATEALQKFSALKNKFKGHAMHSYQNLGCVQTGVLIWLEKYGASSAVFRLRSTITFLL